MNSLSLFLHFIFIRRITLYKWYDPSSSKIILLHPKDSSFKDVEENQYTLKYFLQYVQG